MQKPLRELSWNDLVWCDQSSLLSCWEKWFSNGLSYLNLRRCFWSDSLTHNVAVRFAQHHFVSSRLTAFAISQTALAPVESKTGFLLEAILIRRGTLVMSAEATL